MTTKRTRLERILGIGHFAKAHTGEDSLITYHTSGGEVVTAKRRTETRAFGKANGRQPLETFEHPLYMPENKHDRKPCSRCGSSKLLKHFTKIKQRNGLVIFHSWCDLCRAEWARVQYYDAKSLKKFP